MPNEKTPVPSPAADHLCDLAMQYSPEKPLYVVAIGAITNVASAILYNPDIIDRIVIVWLGGHDKSWPDTKEFNLWQDVAAARVVFGCGAPVIQLPCMGVVSAFYTTQPELEYWLRGKNELSDYLCDNTIEAAESYAKGKPWTRVIWDISTICCIIDPRCYWCSSQPRFYTDEKYGYHPGQYEGTYEHVDGMHRDHVFSILFGRLKK